MQFYNHFILTCNHYYRPQRSWGKVMFLHVSVILFMGEGVWPIAYWDTQTHPGTRGRHTTPSQDQRQAPPQHSACWEIRATSGRYASCSNAILFLNTWLKHFGRCEIETKWFEIHTFKLKRLVSYSEIHELFY